MRFIIEMDFVSHECYVRVAIIPNAMTEILFGWGAIKSGCSLNKRVSYLVVDRAVVYGVRAMAPRHRVGCHGTKVSALEDRLPE